MKKAISFICLIVCTLIWGTTFIAQDQGMDNIGPFTFNSVRFYVGFLAVAPFVFLFEKKKIKQQINNDRDHWHIKYCKKSRICNICIKQRNLLKNTP